MLNNIINDLRSLEGKEVGSGYFRHIYTNEVNADTISILDVLENLKQYEIEVSAEEFLEIEEYDEIRSDNSYNWNSPIGNDFNYSIYKSSLYEGIIVEFSVHRYGDVRYNYTEEAYFRFNDEYEFYEVLEESNKYFTIEKNNIEYDIYIDIFSESPRIYIEEDDEDIEGYEAYELLEELLED